MIGPSAAAPVTRFKRVFISMPPLFASPCRSSVVRYRLHRKHYGNREIAATRRATRARHGAFERRSRDKGDG
jgi:hypothetical protein